jgi:acetyl esterase/lipase
MKLAQRLKCRQLCILQYSLLPKAKYPTQLAQAAEALRHLLGNFAPHQVAIGGDSAGGNMVLGLLAQLNTAHPDIKPIDMPSPVASAICISPRCSNATTAKSFIENAEKDIIDAASLKAFVEKWQPVSEHVWAAADRGGEAFWTGEHAINASKMFIVAGADECYRDDIQSFANLISAGNPEEVGEAASRQLVIVPKSVHVQAVVDLAMNIENGSMTKALLDWTSNNPVDQARKE